MRILCGVLAVVFLSSIVELIKYIIKTSNNDNK